MKRTVRFTLNSRKFGSQTTVEGVHVGDDNSCELIISVTASAELRKARILQRDSITEEAAQARMDAQLPEQFFVEHSDFIIKNNKDCRNLEVVSEEVIAKIKEYYIRRYQVPS